MRETPDTRPITDETIFAEALTLPAGERREFVERECAANAIEAGRVLALLRNHDRTQSFLDVPAPAAALRLALATPPEPGPGDSVGRYRLLERIGEGGFGIVYVAEQREPVRRRVALKLIRLGMDTREFVARFEAERQALALMDHPNIARVFDAGATESGRPFLVMELVRGIPITKYCDEQRLSLRARLELFIAVCGAIQHAHQKGVIHRDLKPSNILVAREGDAPVPKVIDFGIAKAVAGPLTDKTLFTQLHSVIGTPAYASPEQMEPGGRDVDTRSDVYSLGALLYELLAGVPPFDRAALEKAGFDEMRRTIREVEPVRPSERVTKLRAAESRAGRPCHSDPTETRAGRPCYSELRSDLDWIVMRCLEKDRTRRYETANALALDLRRYLDDEPVVARPPSRAYRVGKFVRRYRTPVLAAGAVAISLLGGLIATGVLLVREKAAAEKSRQVAQFMKDMLGSVGPSVARGRDTTLLREVLDSTIRRLDTELRDQPDVAADLRHTLGIAFREIGEYDRATTLWRESIAARRALGDNDSAALAATLHKLGTLLWRLNKVDDAERALQEALAIRRRTLGPEHFDVGTTLAALGHVIGSHRYLREREALAREGLEIQRKYPGRDDDEVAQTLMILGFVLNSNARYDEAQTVLRESVAIRRRLHGDSHPHLAESLAELASSYHSSARNGEVHALRREVLQINRKMSGLAHANLVGALLRFTARRFPAATFDEDLRLTRDAFADLRKVLAEDSPDLAVAQLALASAIDQQPGGATEAEPLAREAVERIRRARENGATPHPDTSAAMQVSALSLYDDGRLQYALAMAEELKADTAFGSVLAYGPPITRTLGLIYFDLGRYAEAVPLVESFARSKRHLWRPANRAMVFVGFATLGYAYREMGRVTDSRRVLEEGLATTVESDEEYDSAQAARGAVRCELGYTAMAEGKFAEAADMFQHALKEYGEVRGFTRWVNFRPRARVVSGLGQALAAQGKFVEAESFVVEGFRELEATRTSLHGDRTKMLREALDGVVRLYRAWGQAEQAAAWEAKRREL